GGFRAIPGARWGDTALSPFVPSRSRLLNLTPPRPVWTLAIVPPVPIGSRMPLARGGGGTAMTASLRALSCAPILALAAIACADSGARVDDVASPAVAGAPDTMST